MEAYENDLERPLLTNTARFYAACSAQWIQEDTCPEYMQKVEQCLEKEKQRVASYLHTSTEAKLLKEVENELLKTHQTTLLEKENTGCMALLRDDKKEDLKRMFELFSRIPKGLDPIAAYFKQHVTDRGMALVKAAEEAMQNKGAGARSKGDEGSSAEQTFMRDVIQLHDDYLSYVMNQFGKNTQFHKALKEAFETFCNKTVSGSTFAELLASFCDNLLKKCSAEKLTDDAVEETLDKVVKLLAYISDKDLFAEFYRKRLARRLLFDRSANDDAEKIILAKLKQQCGSTFTSKLEGMVTDMAIAKDFQQKFQQWAEPKKPKVEISVSVLTTGFWPTYKFVELTLPREMVEGVELFKEFYDSHTKHRKLTWIYALGMVQLAGKFDVKPMELMITPFQARRALCAFIAGSPPPLAAAAERSAAGWEWKRLAVTCRCPSLLSARLCAGGGAPALQRRQDAHMGGDQGGYQPAGACGAPDSSPPCALGMCAPIVPPLFCAPLTGAARPPQDEDVTRALHSLACAKFKILTKSPEGKTISQTDSFSVNWSFTDKMRRIKVPLPPVDEKKKVHEEVDKDRRFSIDAAIVRWMKSRKVVQHQQLVMEVSNQLKHFQPDFKARALPLPLAAPIIPCPACLCAWVACACVRPPGWQRGSCPS